MSAMKFGTNAPRADAYDEAQRTQYQRGVGERARERSDTGEDQPGDNEFAAAVLVSQWCDHEPAGEHAGKGHGTHDAEGDGVSAPVLHQVGDDGAKGYKIP